MHISLLTVVLGDKKHKLPALRWNANHGGWTLDRALQTSRLVSFVLLPPNTRSLVWRILNHDDLLPILTSTWNTSVQTVDGNIIVSFHRWVILVVNLKRLGWAILHGRGHLEEAFLGIPLFTDAERSLWKKREMVDWLHNTWAAWGRLTDGSEAKDHFFYRREHGL